MTHADSKIQQGIIYRGSSSENNTTKAVLELAEQLRASELNAMIFFCSPTYDLEILGQAISEHFKCPVVGCTTAGEIISPAGYVRNSLIGVGFASPDISFNPIFIPSLTDFINTSDSSFLLSVPSEYPRKQFGMLLIDGLSLLEERVVAEIHKQLRGIPLIGGSAGDGLNFGQTFIYHDGKFYSNAATLSVFSTTLPFKTFHFQHFSPTDTKLVITEADVTTRKVYEINGFPATAEYARIVGVTPDELSPAIFATHPLMLRIGGEYYVRAIQKADYDGSLTFYCAIENGLVLTIAKSNNLPENLKRQLAELTNDLPDLQLIIGCDCILRRFELEQYADFDNIAGVLSPYPFIGFSTYGEQYSGIHVNQTLTGVAIGAPNGR